MDVNVVWKVHPLPSRECYWYEEASHRLDVWKLTIEQREELIEDLMALKDTVEKEEVGSAPEEDFV